jgi:competence protein ComEC
VKLPAFWSAILFISGIWIGRKIVLPDLLIFLMALALFSFAVALYLARNRRWAWVAIALCLFIAGLFRINLDLANPPGNDISHFNDLNERITLIGEIVREPDLHPDKTNLIVRADTLYYRDTPIPVSGLVIVKLKYLSLEFNYADYIMVSGFLSTPTSARNPGAFDYRKYLATKKVKSFISIGKTGNVRLLFAQSGNPLLRKIVIPLRKYILAAFNRSLDHPQSALIAGFLIGETRFIPPDIFQNFRDTGTLHLLAVSGSNVALVIGTVAFFLTLMRVPIKIRYIISLLVILLFCNLSYNQPSVVRASVMISFYLVGKLAYRNVNYINIISMSALVILMFEPVMLWDVGFQLSFASAFGLICFLPLVFKKLSFAGGRIGKALNWMLMIFLASLVAQLAVAPILAYSFNTIPLVGIISNLVVVPLSSLAVIFSMVLSFVGWLRPVADRIGMLADWLLAATITSVKFFAGLKIAKLNTASPAPLIIALYYITLILAFKTIARPWCLRYLVAACLLLGNVLVWKDYLGNIEKKAEITVLDIGREGLLDVRTAHNRRYLFGGLKNRLGFNQAEKVLAPYLIAAGTRHINGCLLDEPNSSDSVLIALSRFGIDAEGESGFLPDNDLADEVDAIDSLTVFRGEQDDKLLALIYRVYGTKVVAVFDLNATLEIPSDNPFRRGDVDILILPEIDSINQKKLDMIAVCEPKVVIFSTYTSPYSLAAAQKKLEWFLIQNEIRYYCTRLNGALRIVLTPQGYGIEATISPSRNRPN